MAGAAKCGRPRPGFSNRSEQSLEVNMASALDTSMNSISRGIHAVLLTCLLSVPASAGTGTITAEIDTEEPVTKVWAVRRQAGTMTTSKGKELDVGMYARTYPGLIENGEAIVDDLPVPGQYALRFATESGGRIEGWDAEVPESDYVEQWPIDKEARRKIFEKLAGRNFATFADDMRVLDIQGNTQNAAALVMKLRTRPFVGGGYKPGEWVWRVERWQWENPMEHTWVPYQERPFYALVRERLYEKNYRELRRVYARHLGGIRLTPDKSEVSLGIIRLPRPRPGVYAVNPDGSMIEPVVIKGPAVKEPILEHARTLSEGAQP